jgi:hypothetical protein
MDIYQLRCKCFVILFLCSRGCQELQETREHLAKMESLAYKAHQAYQDQLVEGVKGGSQEREAHWGLLGDQDPVVKLDLKELMDCL